MKERVYKSAGRCFFLSRVMLALVGPSAGQIEPVECPATLRSLRHGDERRRELSATSIPARNFSRVRLESEESL